MIDLDWTLIIVALIGASAATYAAWSARQATANSAQAAKAATHAVGAVQQLTIEVDGRLSDLLAATREAAGAAGELRGRDAAHREADERDERDEPGGLT